MRVVHRPDVVDAMAVDAIRRLRVPLGELLAVDALAIQGRLIGALAGLVLAHEGGVAMATPAVFRHVFVRDADLEAAARVHGQVRVVLFRVAAMTIGATHSILVVDIVLKDDARAFLDAVAFEARVFRGPSARGGQRNQEYR